MKGDDEWFSEKFRQYSVVKECPRCHKPSFSFIENSLLCSNCGYKENIPMAR